MTWQYLGGGIGHLEHLEQFPSANNNENIAAPEDLVIITIDS